MAILPTTAAAAADKKEGSGVDILSDVGKFRFRVADVNVEPTLVFVTVTVTAPASHAGYEKRERFNIDHPVGKRLLMNLFEACTGNENYEGRDSNELLAKEFEAKTKDAKRYAAQKFHQVDLTYYSPVSTDVLPDVAKREPRLNAPGAATQEAVGSLPF